ncbi:rhomboid family intramembrane serine protease [Hyphococcus luteus]|uniref:Peptidase S54 rhomboid domain-containing protein n=1 Tax=Hyphococcus luteus TaxID=2058213 RepID=A0A2S7K8W4_9PROT|nr:rhomboid family intramembrane serine protease [Marinicaulis flavus]PQA88921.1 hypothetical protein CW354_02930 [Marinicaulis flavus]
MTSPEDDDQRSLLAMIIDPPNAIAGLCALMAALHAALAFAPARLVGQVWRLFELSPRPVLMALERGDVASAARAFLGYMFFHVNAAHLLINLAAILALGAVVYREMEARAAARKSDAAAAFIAFFMISGMAAGAAFVLARPDAYQPMIGASGGAAGLAGACAWLFVTRTGEGGGLAGDALNFVILVLTSAVLIIASIYLDTSPLSHKLFGSASAWQAHVGGYVFGVFAYPLFERLAGAAAR